jgi:hypothetical protein
MQNDRDYSHLYNNFKAAVTGAEKSFVEIQKLAQVYFKVFFENQ